MGLSRIDEKSSQKSISVINKKCPCCKRNIWIDVVLLVMPSIVIIVITLWIFKSTNNNTLFYLLEPQIDKYLSYNEYNNLMKLMDKGVVISADDIISNLLNYYNILITILLTIIAFIIVIVIQTNKLRNEEIINDMVKQEVENRHDVYTGSSKYKDDITSIIENSTENRMKMVFIEKVAFDQHKEFYQTQISDLIQQTEKLKKQIEQLTGHTNGNS